MHRYNYISSSCTGIVDKLPNQTSQCPGTCVHIYRIGLAKTGQEEGGHSLYSNSVHVRSVGSFLPLLISTTGTCSSSASIEAALGNFPPESTMTTRCNLAEVVYLRAEAKSVSSSMNCSERSQFKNERVVNEGGDDGSNRKTESQGTPVSHSTASVSRLGKNDRWSIKGLRRGVVDDSWWMRRNSRTFVRGSRGNSMKRSLEV